MSKKTELALKSDTDYWQMLPKCLLGIRSMANKSFCMEFVSDESIMYSCGVYMVLLNLSKHTKQYFPLENSEKVSAMFIFLEFKLIVLEEKTSMNKVNLHFLDIETGIKMKSIATNFNQAIVDLKLSSDGSRLLIQHEGFMWPLSLWHFEKMQMVCSTSIIDHTVKPKHSVKQISFYPNRKNKILVIGHHVLHSYSIVNESLVQDWEIRNTELLACHLWTSPKEVLLGDYSGQILRFNVDDHSFMNAFHIDAAKEVVNTIMKFSKGIICLVDKKNIFFYKQQSDGEAYTKSHFVALPANGSGLGKLGKTLKQLNSKVFFKIDVIGKRPTELIEKLILNRNENILLCATTWKRIYKLELTNEAESSHDLNFTLLESFHSDSILSLDVCHRKPLVVTCGKDGLFQMWNYETEKLEYSKYFDEDLLSVAVHPTGLYVAIATFEKINYCTIYFDDLRCTKIINTGNCHYCTFSNGGQYISACTANSVFIYSSITYEERIVLKPISGKLQHFLWTKDDDFIITCSKTGFICMWDTDTAEKICEYAMKTNGFSSVDIFQSKSVVESVFVLDSGSEIKELSVALNEYGNGKKLPIKGEDLVLQNSIKSSADVDSRFTAFCCDMLGFMLLAGQANGRIRILPYPYLKDYKKKNEFCGHHVPVSRLRFSRDNSHMVSCSLDGTVIVWAVTASFSFQDSSKLDRFDEVLITKTDLQARNIKQMMTTKNLLHQNEITEYELRLKEMSNSEKTKALDYDCKLNLTAMRSVLKELKTDNEAKAKEFDEKMQKIVKMFENDLNTIQEKSEKELIQKYLKIDALTKTYVELTDAKKQDSGSSIGEENTASDEEKELSFYYECKMRALDETQKRELQKLQYEIKLSEEENRQIESHGDDEIEVLKRTCEIKLDFYRKDNKELQLEICFMRKKLTNDEEKFQSLNDKREAFTEFLAYKQEKHQALEQKIEAMRKRVEESTKRLAESDEQAFRIKHKNRQFEKMRFINEYQIICFQNEIKPLAEQNKQLEEEIDEYTANCQQVIERQSHLNETKDELESSLLQMDKNLSEMNNKYHRTQALETLIHQAIVDLNEMSDESEDMIKKLLLKIINKLPQLNEEITIDKEALIEIDNQTNHITSVIKKKQQAIHTFEAESKEAAFSAIEGNLLVYKNIKKLELKRKGLEVRLKNAEKELGLTKFKKTRLVDNLINVVRTFNLGQNTDSSVIADLQQLQLKAIQNLVTECYNEARKLNGMLEKADTPEYKEWEAIIGKFLNTYVID